MIEMNPRVSRSSALASKATGYPIAKVAAKLAVGYTLDEIPNDLTKTTPASFEPTLDYVVVKFPRFAFEKFPGADPTLGTQMKSVGEAMGIGRTFTEAFLKAIRSRELDPGAATPWATLDDMPDGVHPWFNDQLARARRSSSRSTCQAGRLGRRLDRRRLGDERRRRAPRALRQGHQAVLPPRRLVRGRGRGRLELLLLDLGRGGRGAARRRRSRASSSSAPARTGSARGSSSTTAASTPRRAFRALGYEAVMVNCNPETVSTDYDTSDRLYFEPLVARGGARRLRARAARGRRDPVRRPDAAEARAARSRRRATRSWARRSRRSTSPRTASASAPWPTSSASAAHRGRRSRGPSRRSPPRPRSATRCSSGRRTCSAAARCASATTTTQLREAMGAVSGSVLVDRFVENAIEIDVDALCDGEDVYIAAVMQHVEEAGVHSGDSSCVLPAQSLTLANALEVEHIVKRLGPALGVVGLLNVQLAIADSTVYVLEANPRASRTVPFATKAIGINLVEAACKLAAGAKLRDLELPTPRPRRSASRPPSSRSPASRAPTRCSARRCARRAR